MFHPVLPHELDAKWKKIEGAVNKTCKRLENGLTADFLRGQIWAGRMGLMVWGSGFCIVQITQLPKLKTLDVVMIGGEGFDVWGGDLFAELKRLAQQHKCKYIQEMGRDGWIKKLQQFQFKPVATVMRCEV